MPASYQLLTEPSQIVAARRLELSLTQGELARKLGYPNPNFISMLESGKSGVPVERAIDFAKALEMSVEWFIEKVLTDRFPQIAARIYKSQP